MNEILKKKLDFIFQHLSQRELAEKINITQWSLLTKIKDNSFNRSECMKIASIYRKLYNQ